MILYEALVGVAPFDGPSPGSVIYRLLHETPAPLPPTAFQGISRDVQGILNHTLAKDPSNRFQNADDLAAMLRAAKDTAWRWEQERPTTALKITRPGPERGPAPLTPPRGFPIVPLALRPAAPGPVIPTPSGSFPKSVGILRSSAKEVPEPRGALTSGREEVRKDVLETTRHQLIEALEINPDNAKAHAMLLVTHYRLGRMDALMQTLRQARDRGIPTADLKAVPRCHQMVQEEMETCRLPLELHGEFLDYLGS